LTAEHIAELATMVDDGKLSSSAAKDVLTRAMDGEGTPIEIAESQDLLQVSDAGALEAAVDVVIADNPDAVEKIKGGDSKPIGFLMGQVMRHMAGKADPGMVQKILRDKTK
jgi:aspartyl-tRNA(Asn)/glutamyl-tRNA(Gln) amidotransferase subunit B